MPGGRARQQRFSRILKRPVSAFALILLIENLFGHPAIRTVWNGNVSSDPRDMSACVCTTILGEDHFCSGYRGLVTFIREPRFTLSGWIGDQIARITSD